MGRRMFESTNGQRLSSPRATIPAPMVDVKVDFRVKNRVRSSVELTVPCAPFSFKLAPLAHQRTLRVESSMQRFSQRVLSLVG